MATKEKTRISKAPSKSDEQIKNLILYNDDYNTFDFIIESLVEVCEHDLLQAENSALIAHYKGKCQIKKGVVEELRPIYVEMTNRKITVEIK